MSPLHDASRDNNVDELNRLLKKEANIEATNVVRRERKEVGGERGRGLQGACMSGCVKGRQWRQVRGKEIRIFVDRGDSCSLCLFARMHKSVEKI